MKMTIKEVVKESIKESLEIKQKLEDMIEKIEHICKGCVECLRKGNKILVCGNGGSAADSQHFAAELVGRFKKERRGIPCIALTTDTSIITAISNDYSFKNIFARQVEALGEAGDILIAISTSGNSENVVKAIGKAKELGIKTFGLVGKDGGAIAKLADFSITIPSFSTSRIQECHILILHILAEIIEEDFFRTK